MLHYSKLFVIASIALAAAASPLQNVLNADDNDRVVVTVSFDVPGVFIFQVCS
jgi:hypothetical protein